MTSQRTSALRKLVAAAAVAALLSACASPSTPNDGPGGSAASSGTAGEYRTFSDDDLTVTEIATELQSPWSIAFVDGGQSKPTTLVSERNNARILQLLPEGGHREVARINGVQTGGEGGLLGMAVHPEDARQLYVYSTTGQGNRVQRYTLTGSGQGLGLSEPETLLEGIPHGMIHNGGRLAFGPDQKLYISTGDSGRGQLAQDVDSLAGKILRIEADGSVPADNPFKGSPVYSYGHRNIQGLGWTQKGRMFASEFGDNDADELNEIEPGKNYGWPDVEGMLMGELRPSPGGDGAEPSDYQNPLLTWPPEVASPSGIAIVDEVVYIANLRGQLLRSVDLAADPITQDHILPEIGRLRDVVVTPDGKLWLLTNNTDGRGNPADGDDRILQLDPEALHPRHG